VAKVLLGERHGRPFQVRRRSERNTAPFAGATRYDISTRAKDVTAVVNVTLALQ
jgi:hypothetical protein